MLMLKQIQPPSCCTTLPDDINVRFEVVNESNQSFPTKFLEDIIQHKNKFTKSRFDPRSDIVLKVQSILVH